MKYVSAIAKASSAYLLKKGKCQKGNDRICTWPSVSDYTSDATSKLCPPIQGNNPIPSLTKVIYALRMIE